MTSSKRFPNLSFPLGDARLPLMLLALSLLVPFSPMTSFISLPYFACLYFFFPPLSLLIFTSFCLFLISFFPSIPLSSLLITESIHTNMSTASLLHLCPHTNTHTRTVLSHIIEFTSPVFSQGSVQQTITVV